MDTKPLSARPSLEQYKKQAKELLKACHSADAETLRRVQASHPRLQGLSDAALLNAQLTLADAQLVRLPRTWFRELAEVCQAH